MTHFKLVAAQAFQPIIAAASLPMHQLERMAERAGLPGNIIEDTQGIVPLHATESFMELVHRKVGDPNFLFNSLSLDAAEKNETQSIVGIPLPLGVTGKEALEGMSSTFNNYITGARFSCQVCGNLLWIERTVSATEWSNLWSVLQYNISIMLLGARRILGHTLLPSALHLPMMCVDKTLPDQLADVPIIPNLNRFGVAFDLQQVVAAGFASRHLEAPHSGTTTEPLAENMHDAVASCLKMFVMSSTTDGLSYRVAQAFGMSSRSYRRQMAELGTSHSKILSDVRLDLALTLFEDHDLTLTDISVELGYAHSGDFTRFFKKRMGCSPTDYRQGIALPA